MTHARGTRARPDRVGHVTCLGCGCACDDIVLTLRDDRIVEAEHACPLGIAWFGNGQVPAIVRLEGRDCGVEEALAAAARLLGGARGRLFAYLGGDLTCAAQRTALTIADRLRATSDGLVSDTAASTILAAQRRGRASATLGELRNRADLVVYWGVDPDIRYPRYRSRYVAHATALHLRRGHRGRTVVSVSIGADRGPAEADLHLVLEPGQELAALAALRARLLGRALDAFEFDAALTDLLGRLVHAKYVAIVVDGEDPITPRPGDRGEALIALAQALNGPTRAALSTLRGGGNRGGAEAVTTWQTGFPFAVDFSRGYPRYQPDTRGAELFDGERFAAALVVGDPSSVPDALRGSLARVPTVVIGPRASEAPFAARIVIDTGVAGIHEAGLGYRMDEVPLPLQAVLAGPRSAGETLEQLAARLEAGDL